MEFRFANTKLESLYLNQKGRHRWPAEVIDGFRKAMSLIDAVTDERDLYSFKGLHYEKLSGDRTGERSLRLNQQWRLIVTRECSSEEEGGTTYLLIHAIEDYH